MAPIFLRIIKLVKEFVLSNKPFVTKAAVIGLEGLQRIVLDGIRASTGREFETGVKDGEGYTLNSPVLPGSGDSVYREKLTSELIMRARTTDTIIPVGAGLPSKKK